MKFEAALSALKEGRLVTRISWSSDASLAIVNKEHPKIVKGVNGRIVANYWTPTNNDLFAEDWRVL